MRKTMKSYSHLRKSCKYKKNQGGKRRKQKQSTQKYKLNEPNQEYESAYKFGGPVYVSGGVISTPSTQMSGQINDAQKGGIKKQNLANKTKSHIVKIFIEMLNMIKLYHWKTTSYAQHKATDELYAKLNEHVDSFVEVLLGKDQSRIKMVEKRIDLLDPNTTSELKHRIFEYRQFLTEMNIYFNETRDSDLLNIRDEILGDINQFLYLLSFNK